VRGALANVPGVGRVDIAAGAPDFTVHYDSKQVKPADIVAKLKAAGETGARVKA
jgi:copper chaperone CopZ